MGIPPTRLVPQPIKQLDWICPDVVLWVKSTRMLRKAEKLPGARFGSA